jgi:hypothetical protein
VVLTVRELADPADEPVVDALGLQASCHPLALCASRLATQLATAHVLAYRAWLAGGLGAMPLAETEPTARVVTSTASSKTWRDNAKTEGIYKRKKREENVVAAFRKCFLWQALDSAVRKAKEPKLSAREPKPPVSTGAIPRP